MWFTFVTARLFHSLSIQPRLAATLLSSCSVANSPTRRVGLSPTLRPASLAQALFPLVQFNCHFKVHVARSDEASNHVRAHPAALALLPLPATKEWGEGRGEGNPLQTLAKHRLSRIKAPLSPLRRERVF